MHFNIHRFEVNVYLSQGNSIIMWVDWCVHMVLTCIIRECTSVSVKDEPALLPGFDLASHLNQVASACLFRDGQVEACVCAVARRLNVSP